MISHPEAYQSFAELLKKYVLLSILSQTIVWEVSEMKRSRLKFSRCYCRLLEEAHLQVEKERRRIYRRFTNMGGELIDERQEAHYRLVIAKFKGYLHQYRYANHLLRSECEQLLFRYWRDREGGSPCV